MHTIYKKDTKGKLRFLKMWTDGSQLLQESGLTDGKTVTHSKVCTEKNVGRANYMSPEDQAIFEMNAMITDKLTKGYFKSIDEAEGGDVKLPMLAKDYKKECHKIDWKSGRVYVQPKLDGMRCLAHIDNNGHVQLISRAGKPIENMMHIEKSLSELRDIILDGELYAFGQTFQRQMELIKKYRPGETETIQFHVYDQIAAWPFDKRYSDMKFWACNIEHVEVVSTYDIESEDALKKYHVMFIGDGYEGSIVRHGRSSYKLNGRSDSLLKYKDFIDIAIPIKDIEPADARPEWGTPVFHWEGAKNNELRAGMKFSHEQRIDFLTNKHDYIGKTAELRFFEYSTEGVPRFPVMVGIRLDK